MRESKIDTVPWQDPRQVSPVQRSEANEFENGVQ